MRPSGPQGALVTRPVPGRPDARLLVLVGALTDRTSRELCAALASAVEAGVERVLLSAEDGSGLRRPEVLTALARAGVALARRGGALIVASRERLLREELERRGLVETVALVPTAADGIRQLGSLRLRPPADEAARPRQPLSTDGLAPGGLVPNGLASDGRAAPAPCVLFETAPLIDPAGPGCRLGGDPLLGPGVSWPRGPERPLVFVCQLDFAVLAPYTRLLRPTLPVDGVLGLFYDAVEDHRAIEPGARRFFRTTWCSPTAAARPVELEEEAPFLPPTALVPRLGESPEGDGHQLLGLPPPGGVHDLGPDLHALEGDEWVPLLRLALSGPGFPLFGTGALWLKTRDLRARCWDSAWFALRSS